MTDLVRLAGWLGLGSNRSRGVSLLAAFGIGVGLAGGFSRLLSPEGRQKFSEFWNDLSGIVSRCCRSADAESAADVSNAAAAGSSSSGKDNQRHG